MVVVMMFVEKEKAEETTIRRFDTNDINERNFIIYASLFHDKNNFPIPRFFLKYSKRRI